MDIHRTEISRSESDRRARMTRLPLVRLAICTFLIVCSGGCASVHVEAPRRDARDAALIAAEPVRRESVAALIDGLPMTGENILRRPIAEGEESTVFLVRIADREEPHRHTRYDITVLLVEGSGSLRLDGRELAMARGDVAHVPRGVSHYFVNSGDVPASAVVVFSPRFTGPDNEPMAP